MASHSYGTRGCREGVVSPGRTVPAGIVGPPRVIVVSRSPAHPSRPTGFCDPVTLGSRAGVGLKPRFRRREAVLRELLQQFLKGETF